MTEWERFYVYQRALHHMQTGQYDYATLEDFFCPDNFVQFGVKDDTYRELVVEVTSRAYQEQELPPLSAGQIDALAELGFCRNAHPNHVQFIPFENLPEIAGLFERCFHILGSDADFVVTVERVGFWSSHLAEMEAARETARQQRGH